MRHPVVTIICTGSRQHRERPPHDNFRLSEEAS
jgi:hypothetical protein